jgi:hypothetical protein
VPSLDPGIIEKFAPCPFCDDPLDINAETPFEDKYEIYVTLSCGNCDIAFYYSGHEEDKHFSPEELLEWWNKIKLCWRCQNWHEEKHDDEKVCFCAIEEYDTVAWNYGKHNSCKDFEKKKP